MVIIECLEDLAKKTTERRNLWDKQQKIPVL